MNVPFVTVIIVNYNSGERLARCLSHLAAQAFSDFEVLVVDNASSDGSEEIAPVADLDVRLLRAGANIGFAAANNFAVRESKSEWLAFLNPDAYARPDWLSEFRKAVDQYPEFDAFGSTQIDAGDHEKLDGAGDVVHALGLYYRGGYGWSVNAAPESGLCASPCAAAAFYRRSVFEDLGGFDERFFCYGEDVDLGFRLWRSGRRAMQLRDAIVEHEGSGVTGRRSDFSIYHGTRNRLWLFQKNLPMLMRIGLSPIHFFVNLAMLFRSALNGEGGAYWRGWRDGRAGMRNFRRSAAIRSGGSNLATAASLLTWSPLKLLQRAPDVRRAK